MNPPEPSPGTEIGMSASSNWHYRSVVAMPNAARSAAEAVASRCACTRLCGADPSPLTAQCSRAGGTRRCAPHMKTETTTAARATSESGAYDQVGRHVTRDGTGDGRCILRSMTAKRTRRVAWAVICLFIVTIALAAPCPLDPACVLTRQPSSGITAAERLKAANDVRAPLVAFMVAIGAVGTLWFTARTYALNREGHVTDRDQKRWGSSVIMCRGYASAVSTRLNESVRTHRTSFRQLFMCLAPSFVNGPRNCVTDQMFLPQDVKAGLQVVARLLAISNATLDLRDAYLSHTDLSGLPKKRTLLEGADLQDAKKPSM